MKSGLKISHKMSLFSMFVTMAVVIGATGFDEFTQYREIAEDAEKQIRVLGEVTAFSIAAPSLFGDARAANDVLDALSANSVVISAYLNTSEKTPLAEYHRLSDATGAQVKRVTIPVRWKSEEVGELVLDMDLTVANDQLYRQVRRSLFLTLMATLVAGIGVYVLAQRITKPFRRLSDVAEQIVSHSDYSLRAMTVAQGDEVGQLTGAFNGMLDHIEVQKRAMDAHSIVAISTPEGEITYANDKLCAITGYSREEIVGENNRILVSDTNSLEMLKEIQLAIKEGRVWSGDMENVKKNGESFWAATCVIPSMNDDGKPDSYIVISTDVTQMKKSEALLRRSQKMDSVGELAGGLAHDFNNLLGIIIGNLDLMSNEVQHNETLKNQLEIAQSAVLRGSMLTRSLLDFSRQSEEDYGPVDVGKVISSFEELIRKSITASISLETHLADDLFTVELNPDDLEDVLINLSLNARDAMPNGGKLIIRIQNTIIEDVNIDSEVKLDPGEYVEISISDNGMGMNSEVREKIFDPFFTTKGKAEGTGLGLAMVYGFVQRVNGYIFVSSKIGRGTTFTIYLPRSEGTAKQLEISAPVVTPTPIGAETILIVDDEVELVAIAKITLEANGYAVVCADNAHTALKVVEKNSTIDLIFSDIVMPGEMSGLDLAAIIADDYPHLKILLTSGFTGVVNSPESAADLKHKVLRKPYRGTELVRRVREALDAGI
jgi:PAS domain S-box-containing protein